MGYSNTSIPRNYRGTSNVSAEITSPTLNTVTAWLKDFESALSQGNANAAAALFSADGHWRDLVAFTWHIRTFSGRDAIRAALDEHALNIHAHNFQVAKGRIPPRIVKRAGIETIEALIAFETATGRGSGVLRLVPSHEDAKSRPPGCC